MAVAAQEKMRKRNGQLGTGERVLVACADARAPAYEAVAGLASAGVLEEFATAFYDRGTNPLVGMAGRIIPARVERFRGMLARRRHAGIPSGRVSSHAAVDLAIAIENRVGKWFPLLRREVARWRTDHFDRALARRIRGLRPGVLMAFSDVGSGIALPAARRLGIPVLLSMVHGDVREEMEVLRGEMERSPEFLPMYLNDGALDLAELGWLHERRLAELELSDLVLVPSEHIAGRLASAGTDRSRIRLVPYAADTALFQPRSDKRPSASQCVFLFAGGITQRKGIKYLLEAWRLIRRPGWSLRLLGGMPLNAGPLGPYRDEVEWLGRVGRAEVPGVMAEADVFVFPSLFEGSAVVTYEALACGLPLVVTAEAGSVARDGLEGLVVGAGDVGELAAAMERLGNDPERRAEMSAGARRRALEYGWGRYQASVVSCVQEMMASHWRAGR